MAAINGLLPRCKAVLVIPSLLKAGFILGGEGGSGVLLGRADDGSWSAPAFYTMGSGLDRAAGRRAGRRGHVPRDDPKGLEQILKASSRWAPRRRSPPGPSGMGVAAATTLAVGADIYSYSRTKGAFAGGSFDGSVINCARLDGTRLLRQAGRRARHRHHNQASQHLRARAPARRCRARRHLSDMARAMAAAVMLQGTGSDVGKSLLVAGLARAFVAARAARAPVQAAEHEQQRGGDRRTAARSGGRRRCRRGPAASRLGRHEPGPAEAAERDRARRSSCRAASRGTATARGLSRAQAEAAAARARELRAARRRTPTSCWSRARAARPRSTCARATSPTWASPPRRTCRSCWSATSSAAA